jgi:EAL and modified HD-GYP domain-containing signal transduction protein
MISSHSRRVAVLGTPDHGRTQVKTAHRHGPVLIGRQSIFTMAGDRFGYELLYRSSRPGSPVDLWSPREQDDATRHVILTALGSGLPILCGRRPAFINATYSFLTGDMDLPTLPAQLGIEVVESVPVDAAVLAGVDELRGRGHLISIDDFSALPDQVKLLGHADIVKIDIRDLARQGKQLLALASSHGARTVIERVETSDALNRCRDLGFDLVQGNLLEPALVLDVSPARRSAARG